jgi:hypothetical protein
LPVTLFCFCSQCNHHVTGFCPLRSISIHHHLTFCCLANTHSTIESDFSPARLQCPHLVRETGQFRDAREQGLKTLLILTTFAVGLRLGSLTTLQNGHKKHSESPEKRVEFLGRVEHYVNKSPMWTHVEGALFVNGVMPPPKGCADIPDDAAQLEDPVPPAAQSQLLGARMLLRVYCKDVENGGASIAERITSDEFLEWGKNGARMATFCRHGH